MRGSSFCAEIAQQARSNIAMHSEGDVLRPIFINTSPMPVFLNALFGKKPVASCSIELKPSAKNVVEESRGNEPVESAQHHAFSDGVMQARCLRARRLVNNSGNVIGIVPIRGFLFTISVTRCFWSAYAGI